MDSIEILWPYPTLLLYHEHEVIMKKMILSQMYTPSLKTEFPFGHLTYFKVSVSNLTHLFPKLCSSICGLLIFSLKYIAIQLQKNCWGKLKF